MEQLLILLLVKEGYSHNVILNLVDYSQLMQAVYDNYIERDYKKEVSVFENSYYYKLTTKGITLLDEISALYMLRTEIKPNNIMVCTLPLCGRTSEDVDYCSQYDCPHRYTYT